MKKTILPLIAVCCLMLAGCASIYGPVAEVDALVKEKDDAFSEISKKLEANPNEAGVDEARKVFESHKASFETKAKVLSDAPRGMNGHLILRSGGRCSNRIGACQGCVANVPEIRRRQSEPASARYA